MMGDPLLAAEVRRLRAELEEARRERLQVGLRAGFDVGALEAERDELRAEVQQRIAHGNALYDAIVRRLAPHYPAGSRDLDWDVLPGTLAALARERDEARAELDDAHKSTAIHRALNERMAAVLGRLRAELDGAHATVDAVFAERDQYMQGQTEATAIARALRAELEKARLTLAAEQGRQEGAPSERWRFRVVNGVGEWVAAVESTGGYQRVEPSRAWTGELVGWLLLTFDGLGHLVETTSHPNARAAMLAADAAVG